jgi:hypothetical protein
MGQTVAQTPLLAMKPIVLTLFSALLIVGFLAACSSQSGNRSIATAPVTTSFAAGDPDTVEVQVTDRDPATQVELVSADGHVYPAYQILRDRTIETGGGGGPSFGVGVGSGWGSWGGSGVSSGVGIGIPLGGGDYYQRELVRTTARIHVEDAAAYRAGWQSWKVRVHIGEAGRVIEMPAPKPPTA